MMTSSETGDHFVMLTFRSVHILHAGVHFGVNDRYGPSERRRRVVKRNP